MFLRDLLTNSTNRDKKLEVPMKKKTKRDDSKCHPQPGLAGPGEPMHPSAGTEQWKSEEASRSPQAAPAPGVPISNREYERLKKRAKSTRRRSPGPIQEDPSNKK